MSQRQNATQGPGRTRQWSATVRETADGGDAPLVPGFGYVQPWPGAGRRPAPLPTEMSAIADATLYLDLLVNQMPRAELVPVQQRAGQLYLGSEVLRAAGVSLPGNPQGEVALATVPGLHTDYDSQNQRLLLQVPPAWLPDQQVGERSLYPASDALSSFGALFNYDLYLNDTDDGGTYLAAWNELRVFDNWGTFASTGQWRQSFQGRRLTTRARVFCVTTPPGASPTSSAC